MQMKFADMIASIEARACFEADIEDGFFRIKIDEWKPYICTALHAGTGLDSFADRFNVPAKQRWLYETPLVDQFISALPITIIATESRFLLDFNRSLELAVAEHFQVENVWNTPFNRAEKRRLSQKYKQFYAVIDCLMTVLKEDFGPVVVYDFYSYNYQDLNRSTPTFNIGTENIHPEYMSAVVRWEKELARTEFSQMDTVVIRNDLYFGRGWFARYLYENHQNVLVLPTEIKKFYCDEKNIVVYPQMIQQLEEQIKQAVAQHSAWFVAHHRDKKSSKNINLNMLSSELQPEVLQIDKRYYDLTKKFELLGLINPQNLESEKNRFLKQSFAPGTIQDPQFKYKHFSIDPLQFKRQIYALPIEKIRDPHIRQVFAESMDNFSDKIDMMTSIGTPRFLMHSIRHYGQPTPQDIENAQFVLHCTRDLKENTEELISAEDSIPFFEKGFEDYGFEYRIEINANSVAKAAMVGSKSLLKIKKNAFFTATQIQALIHHEIGVHMVTSINGKKQPLKLLYNGLPGSTETQEGLSILSEYTSGSLSFERLREIAWRTMATQSLVEGKTFSQTFKLMTQNYQMGADAAFYLVARIYRGGGFTKDHVYLRGFARMFDLWQSKKDLSGLFIGKISLPYHNWVNEMMERKIFPRPEYLPLAIQNPSITDSVVDFVVQRLKV